MQARFRPHQFYAHGVEPALERVGPDAVQHRHRGDVQGVDQGFLDRDFAVENLVEILGLIVAEARRYIHQLRVGRDQAVLETEAVDKRFQARPRRTQGARHVDPAARPVEPARTDACAHAARFDVDDQDGDRRVRALGLGRHRRHRLKPPLQAGVECRDHRRLQALDVVRQPSRRVPGQGRKHQALRSDRLGHGLIDLDGVDDAGFLHALEDQVARRLCRRRTAVGTARFRRLRQADQQGLFAQSQALGFVAEIAE